MHRADHPLLPANLEGKYKKKDEENKKKLRKALRQQDDTNCWVKIQFREMCTFAKLLAVNGMYYSFVSYNKTYCEWEERYKFDNYLLHEGEFYIHWIGCPRLPNYDHEVGGRELEDNFYMYHDCEHCTCGKSLFFL